MPRHLLRDFTHGGRFVHDVAFRSRSGLAGVETHATGTTFWSHILVDGPKISTMILLEVEPRSKLPVKSLLLNAAFALPLVLINIGSTAALNAILFLKASG